MSEKFKLAESLALWITFYVKGPTMLKGSIQPQMSPPTNIISDSFIYYQEELFLLTLKKKNEKKRESGVTRLQYALLFPKF